MARGEDPFIYILQFIYNTLRYIYIFFFNGLCSLENLFKDFISYLSIYFYNRLIPI